MKDPDPGGRSINPLSREDVERELERLREQITEMDDRLIRAIGERRELVLAIGRLKAALGLPVMDPRREAQVVRNAAARARDLGVDEEMTRDVIWRIIASARAIQDGSARWPGLSSTRDPSDDHAKPPKSS
jgi:chorismate mutase